MSYVLLYETYVAGKIRQYALCQIPFVYEKAVYGLRMVASFFRLLSKRCLLPATHTDKGIKS